jgi:hypothetical protein
VFKKDLTMQSKNIYIPIPKKILYEGKQLKDDKKAYTAAICEEIKDQYTGYKEYQDAIEGTTRGPGIWAIVEVMVFDDQIIEEDSKYKLKSNLFKDPNFSNYRIIPVKPQEYFNQFKESKAQCFNQDWLVHSGEDKDTRFRDTTDFFAQAAALYHKGSGMIDIIASLMQNFQELDKKIYANIGREVHHLVCNLVSRNMLPSDKFKAINKFHAMACSIVNPAHIKLMKGIAAFLIGAVFLTAIGSIGFGIGIAAGAWIASSFFTVLAGASAAAIGVVAAAATGGGIAAGGSAYLMFRPSKEENAITAHANHIKVLTEQQESPNAMPILDLSNPGC